MAENEKSVAESVKEVMEATAPDAPKKNAVPAEASPLSNSAEDLGAAVVKPTDSNPDATKKVKEVSGQAPQKSEGAPDPMPTLKKEGAKETEKDSEDKEIKEGEMPAGLKKYLDKKADKKDGDKEEGYDKKMKKEELDVTEHVDALIAGESDLSEEFKNKAATIFESAIKSKVREIEEHLEVEYNNKFEQETAKHKEELTEKVDSYLSYVVEEWMKENEIALERGIKGEIAEDFISGLKKLFAEHYIDVPDEKYNVLEEQASKIEDLEKKLNEQIEKNVELNKDNTVKTRNEIMSEVASDLADTAKEKFAKLAEEIDYSDADTFKAKCETIKESYFGKKEEVKEDLHDVAAGESSNEDLSNAMAAYTAAISKTKDIKLSNR